MDVQRSAASLEQEFFCVFFAALAEQGEARTDWRAEGSMLRFRSVHQLLERERGEDEALQRLARRLRPDPVTGAFPALDAALDTRVWPGVSRTAARQVVEALPPRRRELVRRAATLFLSGDQDGGP